MRSPRSIALEKNSAESFDKSVESYDAVAGAPAGVAPQGPQPKYLADPVNPPEQPAPCKNLSK